MKHDGKRSGSASASGRRRTVLRILLLALLAVSCAQTTEPNKPSETSLLVGVEAFNSALRWENFKACVGWLAPELREPFWNFADTYPKKIKLLDLQVRNAELKFDAAKPTEATAADVLVAVRYYGTTDPTVQNKLIHEYWVFNKKDKLWRLSRHDIESLLSPKRRE